ncbi:hypothetical protein ACIQ4I_13350 [Rummeliibacillus sp. NPDC094406]|uniref:WapI family immunity protein n=1 Tax=Rummeliibacillus sp. NPDC094406 TaxID=3364511 RepID=UPI00381D8CDE
MNNFIIDGKQGFIQIEFNEVFGFPDETSFDGGYDVQGKLSLKSENYYVKDAEVWFTTGQIYTLFKQLQKAYKLLKGAITFSNRDETFKFEMKFNPSGQIEIEGFFQEFLDKENILQFEFLSDQSYLMTTLEELKNIVENYGDLKGIKK